jgi:hypothetical protein
MSYKKFLCFVLLVFVFVVSSQNVGSNKKPTSNSEKATKIDIKKISSLYKISKPNPAQKTKEIKKIPKYIKRAPERIKNSKPNLKNLRDFRREEEMNYHRHYIRNRKPSKKLKAKFTPTKPSNRKFNSQRRRNLPKKKRIQKYKRNERNSNKYKRNKKYSSSKYRKEKRRNFVKAPKFKSPSYYGKTVHEDHDDYYHDEDHAHEIHDEFVDHPSVKNYIRGRDEL